jgi:adenylate kinase family enzyme
MSAGARKWAFNRTKEMFTMRRVAIIGNAGGGKSRLAHAIAVKHDLPLHAVDQFQWRPGWEPVPEAEMTKGLDALIAGEKWIIDGWGPWPSLERRFIAADTIILVDHPLWVHFWWAAERQIACARGEGRPDGPEGCNMLDVTQPLFKMIWDIDRGLMPKLRTFIGTLENGRQIHRITSPAQLDEFAHSLDAGTLGGVP